MAPTREVELSGRAEADQCQGQAGMRALRAPYVRPAALHPGKGKDRQVAADTPDRHHREAAPTWGLYPLIVVGIHADLVLLHVEGELTQLHGPQLVVAVQVGPSPQAAVDDMREPLPMGHLQPAIQGPVGTVRGQKKQQSGFGLRSPRDEPAPLPPGSLLEEPQEALPAVPPYALNRTGPGDQRILLAGTGGIPGEEHRGPPRRGGRVDLDRTGSRSGFSSPQPPT